MASKRARRWSREHPWKTAAAVGVTAYFLWRWWSERTTNTRNDCNDDDDDDVDVAASDNVSYDMNGIEYSADSNDTKDIHNMSMSFHQIAAFKDYYIDRLTHIGRQQQQQQLSIASRAQTSPTLLSSLKGRSIQLPAVPDIIIT